MYKCEICGKGYKTKEGALRCEEIHMEINRYESIINTEDMSTIEISFNFNKKDFIKRDITTPFYIDIDGVGAGLSIKKIEDLIDSLNEIKEGYYNLIKEEK